MSTTAPTWDDVEVPQGDFIGWGDKPGQILTLAVLSYDPTGGKDFNEKPCPQVVGTLVEPFTNYREKGTVTEELATGQLITMTCGLANLKRNVSAAAPESGDLLRLHFHDLEKVDKGYVKLFKAQVARGAARAAAASDDDLV